MLADAEQLVAAMPADVVEHAHHEVVATDEQEALPSDLQRDLVTRRGKIEICRPPDTGPGSLEHVCLLPREDLG